MILPVGVTEFFSNIFPQSLVNLFEIITVLGEKYVVIAFVGLFYWCIDKRKGQFIALCTVSSLGLNNFAKNIFRVPRPFDVSNKVSVTRRETATGYSFPSGHTQNASTAAFSAAHKSKRKKDYVTASAYVVLVGLSRLVLGVHYITDVIGAVILSFISIALVSAVLKLCIERGYKYMFVFCIPAFLSLLSVFIPGAQAKDALTSCGLALGVTAGIVLENRYIDFTVCGSVFKRALRFAAGFAMLIAVTVIMKAVMPDIAVFRIIRYFIIGIFATAFVPFAFKKLNL